jgi:cyclase
MVEKRLESVGNGVFAYTQTPGSWGWSNAGLVTDGERSLLVDTLFDRKLTAEMLEAMRRATSAARHIDTVVNTHGNGDHCYGNSLVADAEILATRGTVVDLLASPPRRTALLLRAGRLVQRLGGVGRLLAKAGAALGVDQVRWLVEAAPFAVPAFEAFDFADNPVVLPSRTFEDQLSLQVGDKRVEIVEVGPAHTKGDAFVYVPDDRVVFTGDILFHQSHPIMWEGPVSSWVAACRRLLALDVAVVVPGHGPLTDKSALEASVQYFETLAEEVRRRYEAGLSAEEAARDISLDAWRGWLDSERVYVNVRTLYRELSGDDAAPDVLELFAGMARFKADRG